MYLYGFLIWVPSMMSLRQIGASCCVKVLQLTDKLTPRTRVHLEKPTVLQVKEKYPAVCGTRSFITAITRARHLPLY